MIGFLQGQVLELIESKDTKVLLLTGGVGYLVSVPGGPAYLEFRPGKSAQFYIYTHVREDALELFGFRTAFEKELFLTLLDVKGIGPKAALSMMSRIEPPELIFLIVERDEAGLSKVPGIGKKTAERVVVELSDKIAKKISSGEWKVPTLSSQALVGDSSANDQAAFELSNGSGQQWAQAKDALVGLGYREAEVQQVLKQMAHQWKDQSSSEITAQAVIKQALMNLSRASSERSKAF